MTKCPYCSEIDHFASAFSEEPKVIHDTLYFYNVDKFQRNVPRFPMGDVTAQINSRGDYLVCTLGGEQFVEKYRDLTVEILGIKFEEEPETPFGPWFKLKQLKGNKGLYLFNACRITHSASDIDVRIHWWPDHNYIININGFPLDEFGDKDLKVVKDALGLFGHFDLRGREGVIDGEKVIREIKKKKTSSVKELAYSLDYDKDTLRKWLHRHPVISSMLKENESREE